MKTLVCIKATPDEQDIVVNSDRTLNLSAAAFKASLYDLNALEAARVLTDQVGGEVIGLSVGGPELAQTKLQKDVISRGLDEYVIVTDAAGLDAFDTAQTIKAAVEKIGGVDLVLFGAGSADVYAGVVGSQVAALLDWPTVNAVDQITAAGSELELELERLGDTCKETLAVQLPAVLSVTSSINTPRIAGMKDILAAGKKPVTEFKLANLGITPSQTTVLDSLLAPSNTERANKVFEGDIEGFVAEVKVLLSA